MGFRWDDPFAEDEDRLPFGAPVAPAPEGSELIGAHTPLGLGRVRWTDSAKAWIVGADFELPLSHFDPSTIKPIFGRRAPRPEEAKPYALPGMMTWEVRKGGNPNVMIDDLMFRQPPPGTPRPDPIRLYAGGAGASVSRHHNGDASSTGDPAIQREQFMGRRSGTGSSGSPDQDLRLGGSAVRLASYSPDNPSVSRIPQSSSRPRQWPPVLHTPPQFGTPPKGPPTDPLAATRKPRNTAPEPPRTPQGYKGFNTPAGWGSLERRADGQVYVRIGDEQIPVRQLIPGKTTPAELLPAPGAPAPARPKAEAADVKRIRLTAVPIINPGAKFATLKEAAELIHGTVGKLSIDANEEIQWHYYVDLSTGLWGYTDPFMTGPVGGDKSKFPLPAPVNGDGISNVAILGGGHDHGNYSYVRPEYKEQKAPAKVMPGLKQFDRFNSDNWSEFDMMGMAEEKGFYTLGTPSGRRREYDPFYGDREWP